MDTKETINMWEEWRITVNKAIHNSLDILFSLYKAPGGVDLEKLDRIRQVYVFFWDGLDFGEGRKD